MTKTIITFITTIFFTLCLTLFLNSAILAVEIPISGTFDPIFGSDLPFEGSVYVFDTRSGAIDINIGGGGPGLTQNFSMDFFNNASFDGSALDFALLWDWQDVPNGFAGGIIDVDAIDLYDGDDNYSLVDLRITLWDSGENFSSHWEWDNGRASAIPEPSSVILMILAIIPFINLIRH